MSPSVEQFLLTLEQLLKSYQLTKAIEFFHMYYPKILKLLACVSDCLQGSIVLMEHERAEYEQLAKYNLVSKTNYSFIT